VNANGRKITAVLVAAFSLLLVFGALLTALAETGFTARPQTQPTQTSIEVGGQATDTLAVLPSSTPQPTPDQPEASDTPEVQNTPDPSASATSRPTATDPAAATQTACTVPEGWITYKVRSGDTLFSIGQLYQTTVPMLQIGNCMGGSTRIITGQTLWVPNNPTLTPSKTSGPTATDKAAPTDTPTKTTAPACYTLTRSHTGSGSDPAASPANSPGCPTGKYTAGQVINLTASPATGFAIGDWTGIDSPPATGSSPVTLTMPASARTVSVTYVQICYSLTLGIDGASTGAGGTPTASASTSGCGAGKYAASETITVTASPDGSSVVTGWIYSNGSPVLTGDPNVVNITMPAAAASLSVTYGTLSP